MAEVAKTTESMTKSVTTSTVMSSTSSSGVPSPAAEIPDENAIRFASYLQQVAGIDGIEVSVIMQDHCYSRPWNWKPENVYIKPIKKLFFSKLPNKTLISKHRDDEKIDIENDPVPPSVPYDLLKSRSHMDEFQRLASFARPDENDEWEEKIEKMLWSPLQTRLFSKVVKIFNSERLARLAKASTPMEPIFRRTSIDTAARRFREALACTGWDWRFTQWLHNLLFDALPQEYLSIYLDILQTLRIKIPQLIDKMIAGQPNLNAKTGVIPWENLSMLLKKTWDPVAPTLNASKPKKLPGNPILIVVPSGIGSIVSSRQQKWITLLGSLGTVVTVHPHAGIASNRLTMIACMDQLVQTTRAKIQDVHSDYPGRSIILVGFNTGAALACQVSQMEHVMAVICLGFPFATVEGKRGAPDDILTDVRCPVMFVIGQNATLARPDEIEDLREKMLVETSLVVIGTADDHLRISTAKKVADGVTQSMVDRCIVDEMGDFVGSILLQPNPLPMRTTAMSAFDAKMLKKEPRKRRNSTSSSVESEPNSPNAKKSRPCTPVSSMTAQPTQSVAAATGTVAKPQQTQQKINLPANLLNAAQNPPAKKKPRIVSDQKINISEHVVTPRASQGAGSLNGGITFNIGSLASLAPIGPLKLTATSTGHVINSHSMIRSLPHSKIMKVTPASAQNNSITKTITGGKCVPKASLKHVTITEKTVDNKMAHPSSTVTATSRASLSMSTAHHSKNLNTSSPGLLQNGKITTTVSPMTLKINPNVTISQTVASSSAVDNSTGDNTPQRFTATKVHPKSLSLEGERSSPLPAGTVPITISKTKDLPKITMSTCTRRQQPISEDIDDLGNILDIPIIFAKDGESINGLEGPQPLATTSYATARPRGRPSNPKVVLISNKQDKTQPRKFLSATRSNIGQKLTATLSNQREITTTPTISVINRSASQSVQKIGPGGIKYTKIVLSKRGMGGGLEHKGGEQQLVLAKNNTKIYAIEKNSSNEHKYAQIPARIARQQSSFVFDDKLEIEDAIKANVIERKPKKIPEIDLSSPTKDSGEETSGSIAFITDDSGEFGGVDNE